MNLSEDLQALLAEQQFECLEWLLFRDYSQETLRAYRSHIKRFRSWVAKRPELSSVSALTTSVVTNFLVELSLTASRQRANYLSPSHRNSVISALSQFFRHMYKRGLILVNPMHDVERPHERRGLPRNILSVEEVFKMLACIDTSGAIGLRNRAALELLYTSGLRSGELAKLNVSDLNLAERLLTVDGKGNRERCIPVGKEAANCLKEYLLQGRSRQREAGSQALFLSSMGGRMDVQSLRRYFRKYAKKAGITKPVDLHGLRHTCATHMLANGADIRYIQTLLGHSSLKSTQIYTRVELTDLKRVLDECHPRDKF